jgi:hypothetical protein
MPERLRFNVYGKHLIEIERSSSGWSSYFVGSEGKRRNGPLIPRDLQEAQLATYLADLYHESSRPDRPGVERIRE